MTTAIMKTDSQIKSDVLNELKWDSRVDETDVGVQVKEGIVTLVGSVDVYAKKIAAREAAHRVHGVLDVVDELQVKVARIGAPTDTDIARAVRDALEWDAFVPDEKITSTVSLGIVTLEGVVPTWSQRADAERVVRGLAGVRGVINQITVMAKAVDSSRIKRIPINSISLEELQKHPYCWYGVGKSIVNYRGNHGPFRSLADLQKIYALKPDQRERLSHYVSFE